MAENALYARFLRGLALAPERPAVRDGDRICRYVELDELAMRMAGAIIDRVGDAPRAVGVLAGKSVSTYAGLLAVLYTGAAVVPLNPGFPVERTRRMLTAAGVDAVLADADGQRVLDELALTVPVLRLDAPATGRPLDGPRPVAPSDVAYMLFTSGSTGRPKGVPITHGNTAHYFQLMDERYDFGIHDVFSQTFDLNFDCAMFDLFCAWGAGACVQPVPPAAYRDLPPFLATSGMTVWFSTPSSIAVVRKLDALRAGSMPGLRWSLFAGEALRAADAVDWQAAAPRSRLENIYGPTELTITVSGYRWCPDASPASCVNGLVPIGSVHDGHDWLLRTESGDFAVDEGELCVTGPQLTPGYLEPADDAGRFLRHDGRSWYRTGDRVRILPGGELVYLGRLDSQVQVQGWRVELSEVEHAARSCPGVRDAVAVTRTAGGTTELVVFYTGAMTPSADLSRHLRGVLPAGMLPRQYRHVDDFPLNPNRKIDRAQLAREASH